MRHSHGELSGVTRFTAQPMLYDAVPQNVSHTHVICSRSLPTKQYWGTMSLRGRLHVFMVTTIASAPALVPSAAARLAKDRVRERISWEIS